MFWSDPFRKVEPCLKTNARLWRDPHGRYGTTAQLAVAPIPPRTSPTTRRLERSDSSWVGALEMARQGREERVSGGTSDMIDVPQTGFSHETSIGVSPQPLRARWVDRRSVMVAEQRYRASLDRSSIAQPAGWIVYFEPEKRHGTDVGAHRLLERPLDKLRRFGCGISVRPGPARGVGPLSRVQQCRSDVEPKDRSPVIASTGHCASNEPPVLPESLPERVAGRSQCMRADTYDSGSIAIPSELARLEEEVHPTRRPGHPPIAITKETLAPTALLQLGEQLVERVEVSASTIHGWFPQLACRRRVVHPSTFPRLVRRRDNAAPSARRSARSPGSPLRHGSRRCHPDWAERGS